MVTKHSNTEDLLLAVVFLILLLFVFSFLNNSPALTGGITGKTVTELKDDTGAVVGHKIVDDPDFETRMVAIERTENLLRIRFSHNAAQALPVWVEGDVTHTFSVLENATPNDVVTLAVMLENNKVPKFKLHIGAESEIFEFGEEQKGFETTGFHTQAFDQRMKRMIVIGIDGFELRNYVAMLNAGNLTNFTRLMQYGGRNLTLNITGHNYTVTAPGNAEIHSGRNATYTGVWDNTCNNPIPAGNTTFERLKVFNSSIVTGSIYGKTTCYVPNGVLGNAIPSVNWFLNDTQFDSTQWPIGSSCVYDSNVSTRAREFIINYTNESFYLFVYFGTPDCTAHVYTDQSAQYNNSFMEIDKALGILLDTLQQQGLENNTPILITADHGWNTGTTSHSTWAADTVVLPLITNNVSMVANATTAGFRKQCDIAPTTLNFFGMNATGYPDIVSFDGCGSMYNPNINNVGSNCTIVNLSTSLTELVLSNSSCFLINGSNLVFNCSGFVIGGNNLGIGINVTDQTNVTIKDCLVENFSTNIWLMRTHNSRITNTTARNSINNSIAITSSNNDTVVNSTGQSNNETGILANSVSNITIRESTGTSTNGRGLLLSFAGNSTLARATGRSILDIGVSLSSSQGIILVNVIGNSVNSSGISFISSNLSNISDSLGNSSFGRGVSVTYSSGNNLTNVTGISNYTYGIALISSNSNTLVNSTGNSNYSGGIGITSGSAHNTLLDCMAASNSSNALYVDSSHYNNITLSRFQNSVTGTTLQNAENNTITYNSFRFNSEGIIAQGSSKNNLVENNTFANNTATGCLFQGSASMMMLRGNTVSNSTTGIKLSGSCHNNTITNNTAIDNVVGIRLDESSQENLVENNTLLQNTEAGIKVEPTALRNILKNNTFSNNAWGIILTGGQRNIILTSTVSGIYGSLNVTNGGFNNTINGSTLVANSTFEMQNSNGPAMLTYTVNLNFGVQRTFEEVMNLSYNRVFVNSTAAPEFNASAVIKLFNLYFAPNPLMDINDNGNYEACTRCTLISSAPGLTVFNVSAFTSYSSNETQFVCGPNSNLSTLANATFNGTYTINVTNSTGYDGLGYALAAGDINNDTFKDIIVSAPFTAFNNETPEAGRVYVIYGIYPYRASGNIVSVANVSVSSSNTNDLVGNAITSGDVNGDGIDDLVVGAPGNHSVTIFFGANRLGNFAWMLSNANVTINVSAVDDLSLAVGDLNNDNITDLIIGEVDYPDNSVTATGRVDVVFGRRTWPSSISVPFAANATFAGTAPNGFFGSSLTAGDLNNDTIQDLVIGAPGTNVSGVLSVGVGYVFFGTEGFTGHLLASANFTFIGEPAVNSINNTYALAGFSLFARADVNNDSIKDLLIGAPRSNAPPDKEDAGTAYIVFGSTALSGTLSLSNANVTLYGVFGNPSGTPPGERAGYAVYARDVNWDFVADVMVGAPMAHANALAEAGIVYNIYGRNAWPRFMNLTNASQTMCGQAEGAFTGFSIGNGSQSTGDPGGTTSNSGRPASSSSPSGVATGGRTFATFTQGSVQDSNNPSECPPEHDPKCRFPGMSCANNMGNPSTCTQDCICPPGESPPPPPPGGGRQCTQNEPKCTTIDNKPAIIFSSHDGGYNGETKCDPADVTMCGANSCCSYGVSMDHLNTAKAKCCCKTSYACHDFTTASGIKKGAQFSSPYEYRTCDQWPLETGSCTENKIEQDAADAAYNECCRPCDQQFQCQESSTLGKVAYFSGINAYVGQGICSEWEETVPIQTECNTLGVEQYMKIAAYQECCVERCGDGKVDPGEYCDPNGDPCDAGIDPLTGLMVPDKCGREIGCHCTKDYWFCDPSTMLIWNTQMRDKVVTSTPYNCFDAMEAGADQQAIDQCCLAINCTADADCPTPAPPNNNCWDAGTGCCQKSPGLTLGKCSIKESKQNDCGAATAPVYTGNNDCKPAAPTPQAAFTPGLVVKNGCKLSLFGTTIVAYDGTCNSKCNLGCIPPDICVIYPQGPGCPCPPPAVGTYPDCACPPGSVGTPPDCRCPPGTTGTPPNCVVCPPGSTDPRCLPVIPPTSCVAEGTCPPPECATPPCDTEPPVNPPPQIPPTVPPTIIQPPVTPPFLTMGIEQPTVVPPPPLPPPVFCQDSSTGEGGVTIDSSSWRNLTYLPEGYDFIAALNLTCSGNYIDMTINVPDNYRDVRAFIRYIEGGHDTLSSEVVSTAKCGDQFIETTRRQQITGWDRPNYTHEELNVTRIVQAVIGPTDAERIVQSGRYSAELLSQTSGSTIVKISSPTFDVPPAAHPNLVIIGTPLLVTINPPYRGKVRITMPYQTPDFIDPDSLAIYVKAGGEKWKYLNSYIDRENMTIVAEVDDVSLFLDNANSAVFAVMGITCSSCKKVDLEKLYDGGSRKAVFLVHGFTTDKLRWQSFIDDMVHTNSDWQIWLVGYPLSMTSDDVATELSSLIEERASEFDKASFIMHSMGGIITQKALKLANDKNLVWPKKVQDMILAGQPGLGSPSADIYGKLFAALVNLRSSSVVWNPRSPLLGEAVAGKQVPRSPDAEYFVIAGRQSYPFTYDLFRTNNTYLPNDGIISIFSARTVGGSQITDNCQHYFELPRTHTDLLDDWLSRKVMQRILFRQDAAENPDEAILGYNKYIHVVDDSCRSGMLIVIGKHMSEAETEDPLNCNCGNGVCGEGETTVNCPVDCVTGYKYYYICRVLPWFIGPLVALLVLLTTAYVYRAINRHERGEGALWIAIISAVLLMGIIGMYLFCGFTMPLAILVLVFVLALLGFTMGHLHAETKGHRHKPAIEAVSVRKPAPNIRKPVPIVKKKAKAPEAEITLIDGNTIKKLEKLLNKARGR